MVTGLFSRWWMRVNPILPKEPTPDPDTEPSSRIDVTALDEITRDLVVAQLQDFSLWTITSRGFSVFDLEAISNQGVKIHYRKISEIRPSELSVFVENDRVALTLNSRARIAEALLDLHSYRIDGILCEKKMPDSEREEMMTRVGRLVDRMRKTP